MRCDEIRIELENLAPEDIACSWDNPGLLAGRAGKEVHTIYLALDADDQVVEDAVREGADLLITHHPLIFKAVKKINDEDFIGRRLLKLIQADISYYAMHTNFDSAPGCMADLAAKRAGLAEGSDILEPEGEVDGVAYGIGRVGSLERPMTLRELAGHVKKEFGLPFVTVYGDLDSDAAVGLCAVSPGSGSSMIGAALSWGADVLITGDIGHHEGIDSLARGMAVIDAGHYGLEHIFMDFMEGYLKKRLEEPVRIIKAPIRFPAAVL
ncbi:MAG: Nif3-like dinuclear metal center hexameric protein [Lachnospiraceae bacterium]|nr:Nif3-like dinuclear metal center hexameric protein [Lachnospiraceae bacterium]